MPWTVEASENYDRYAWGENIACLARPTMAEPAIYGIRRLAAWRQTRWRSILNAHYRPLSNLKRPLVWPRGTARLLKMPCFLGKRPEDQPPKQKTREAISVLMNIGRGAAPLPRRNETVSPPDGIG
jgi:hypothetical protein